MTGWEDIREWWDVEIVYGTIAHCCGAELRPGDLAAERGSDRKLFCPWCAERGGWLAPRGTEAPR